MYGPRPSVKNIYVNTRVGDQNLFGPGPSIRNSSDGIDLRSVVIPGNLLTEHPNEVNFRGEIDGQNLHGCRSPKSQFILIMRGVAHILGILRLLIDPEMNRI